MIILTILKYLFFFILTCAGLYGILFLVGLFVPVNRKYRPVKGGVEFYLGTNGLHTEFILPALHSVFDWTKILNPDHYNMSNGTPFHYGFGWGDRAFYLDIESWSEVTFAIGFQSLAIPSEALMHIKSYENIPPEKFTVKKVSVTNEGFNNGRICH